MNQLIGRRDYRVQQERIDLESRRPYDALGIDDRPMLSPLENVPVVEIAVKKEAAGAFEGNGFDKAFGFFEKWRPESQNALKPLAHRWEVRPRGSSTNILHESGKDGSDLMILLRLPDRLKRRARFGMLQEQRTKLEIGVD